MATMSGTLRTAELIGEVAHASPEAAKHAAKMLRTRGGLWPAPGRGVRNAAIEVEHLTNLLVALACGDPVRAVETVGLVRGMGRIGEPFGMQVKQPPNALQPPEMPQDVPDTLGGVLDWLVQVFAAPGLDEETRYLFQRSEVLVVTKPEPYALLTLDGRYLAYSYLYALLPARWDELPGPGKPETLKQQHALSGYAFERLADIWNEFRGHSPSANETAASPAREAAAARDQPAKADGCRVQTHPRGEREKSPTPSVWQVDHSHHPPPAGRAFNDRHGTGAASGPAA